MLCHRKSNINLENVAPILTNSFSFIGDGDIITSGFCSFITNKCYWQDGTPVIHFVNREDVVTHPDDVEPTLILRNDLIHTLTAVVSDYRGHALCEQPSEPTMNLV